MTRESEVATYLRTNSALVTLVPGGIYAYHDLPDAGISDALTTPDVWTSGTFHNCIVVRQGPAIPDYRIQDEGAQVSGQSRVVRIWIYATTAAAIEAVSDKLYALMQGHGFTGAWKARKEFSVEIMDAPDLPGVKLQRDDYRIISLRTVSA